MASLLVFLPGIVFILFSIISRRVIEPIVTSVMLAYAIKHGSSFPQYFLDGIYETLSEETISFLIVMLLLFGGLINVITMSNGIKAMSAWLGNRIHSRRATLLTTWLLGVSLFMDDYLNSLIVGTTMRHVTDHFNIPREQVALVSITTSVPLAILAPISTWAVFIYGVLITTSLDTSSGQISTYMNIIPHAIYPIICIIGTFLIALGVIPNVNKLKYVCMQRNTNILEALEEHSNDNPIEVWNFILPIFLLIFITVVTSNIAYGLIASIMLTILWLKISHQQKLTLSIDGLIEGMSTMTTPLIFIVFAFTFGRVLTELGFIELMLALLESTISRELLPVFSFWMVAILVFSGVDVWAVVPLVLPLFIPLSQSFSISPYLIIGAILSGISFGTQMCFISESNILVSSTLGTKPMKQVLYLLPYALVYAGITSIIYLLYGFV